MDSLIWFNILYFVMFTLGIIWLSYKLIKTNKFLKIKVKFITASRILFMIGAFFAFLTVIMYDNIIDILRTVLMGVAIILYIFLQDGIGEEGIYLTGMFTANKEIKSYDYKVEKKKIVVYFTLSDLKSKKNDTFNATMDFDNNKLEALEKYFNETLKNKYKRIKK